MASMKLWVIRAERFGYDEFDGFVVRAETEEAALAKVNVELGGRQGWHIQPLPVEGATETIMESFNAG